MREFIIQANDADQRVDKFLMKTLPTLPKSLMYKYIRNKKIKVNRKRCEISQRLQEGDIVLCFIAEEFFETKKDYAFLKVSNRVDCLYEDDDVVLLNKESGLLTHSDSKEVQDNLQDRFLHYLYDKKVYDPSLEQSFTPALCHRLDRNTQGIVIAAKKASALRAMNAHIKAHDVKKRYVCIVEGKLLKPCDHLLLYHEKDEKQNKVTLYAKSSQNRVQVETSYQVLETCGQYSLVEVLLHTGKSHQIRAVMAYLKHPLYGDVKYGAHKTKEKNYQALCAYKVTFDFEDEVLKKVAHKTFTLAQNDVISLYEKLKKNNF